MDPRLKRTSSQKFPFSQVVLKAQRPDKVVHKLAVLPKNPTIGPSQAQTEHERSMWGPHPDPIQNWVEEKLYLAGAAFLRDMLLAVTGKKGLELAKADDPSKAPSWGQIARLFGSPEPPEKKLSIWESLIDAFTTQFFPQESIEAVASAWALRSSLLSLLGEKVKKISDSAKNWAELHGILPPHRKKAIEWQKAHGARFITDLKDNTRKAIKNTLVTGEMENLNRGQMEQRLLDNFGKLNRDWRRVVLTETASSAASGKLAQVAGLGGFEAVWTGTPNACPFCYRMYRRAFLIVPADKAKKDGQKEVWPGKSNIGRSVSLYRKDGTKRKPEELWWPCIPAHPNCCCSWEIRKRANKDQTPLEKEADKLIAQKMAERRRRDEEFLKYVSTKR